MNYKESKKFLEYINKAENILISCHWGPDIDSTASTLALYYELRKIKKSIKIVAPNNLTANLDFLSGYHDIEIIDVNHFDYTQFDLIIMPDMGDLTRLYGHNENIVIAKNTIILVVDHHEDNKFIGKVNIVDTKISSASEVIYLMYQDWKIKPDNNLATILLTGIFGDTNVFQSTNATSTTLRHSAELMDLGADKNKIILNISRSYSLDMVHYWAKALEKMTLDSEYNFVWSAVDFETYSQYPHLEKVGTFISNLFSRIIKGADFGIIMTENPKNHLNISLRERNGFDVSVIAHDLGGGGHPASAGAEIDGMPFDQAVIKVLEIARKRANKR